MSLREQNGAQTNNPQITQMTQMTQYVPGRQKSHLRHQHHSQSQPGPHGQQHSPSKFKQTPLTKTTEQIIFILKQMHTRPRNPASHSIPPVPLADRTKCSWFVDPIIRTDFLKRTEHNKHLVDLIKDLGLDADETSSPAHAELLARISKEVAQENGKGVRSVSGEGMRDQSAHQQGKSSSVRMGSPQGSNEVSVEGTRMVESEKTDLESGAKGHVRVDSQQQSQQQSQQHQRSPQTIAFQQETSRPRSHSQPHPSSAAKTQVTSRSV